MSAVATLSNAELAQGTTFNEREVELIKTQIARGATDDELMHFIQVASSRGLDPFRKHVYAVKRWDSSLRKEVMSIQVSIEGLRLIAERTGQYEGQVGPFWCGQDGEWVDVWLQNEPPAAAKVGIWRRGFREPLWGIATFKTYAQTKKDGELTQFWSKMPEVMIAKCAEAAALRRAFPEETGGLYVREEMDQANNHDLIDTSTGEVRTMTPRQRPQEPRRAPEPAPQASVGPTDDQEALIDAWEALDKAITDAMPDRDDEERGDIATAAFAKAGFRDLKAVPLKRITALTNRLETERESTVAWLLDTYREWAELNTGMDF